MSQTERVLLHLKAGHAIDPLTALHRFGTLRLAARIAELREAGYRITCRHFRTRSGKVIGVYKLSDL